MDDIAETTGLAIYRRAKCDPNNPPKDRAFALARRIYGKDIIYRQPHALDEAKISTVDGARRIVLRDGIDRRRANFFVGWGLARLVLEEDRHTTTVEERALAARSIGAWLVAPTEAFRACVASVGVDLPALSKAFEITATACTLRLQETGGPDVLVTTPAIVHRRGPGLAWLSDEDARALATKRTPRSVRRIAIRDEPGRVALLRSNSVAA